MRMLKSIVPALLALLLLGGMTATGAAQSDPTTPDMDVEGLEKMYGRSFNADMMAMIDPEDPDAAPSGWFMLMTMVLEFDSEDNAKAGLEQLNEEAEASDPAGQNVEMEEVELDLDIDHTALKAEDEQEGVTTTMLTITAQDGEYVYFVMGMTFDDDPTEVVGTTVTEIKDADASDDEEMFHEDGTSMGGLWAKLPSLERVQEQVESLTTASDMIYYPAPEGTPAA